MPLVSLADRPQLHDLEPARGDGEQDGRHGRRRMGVSILQRIMSWETDGISRTDSSALSLDMSGSSRRSRRARSSWDSRT
jgi:hypothetical protein